MQGGRGQQRGGLPGQQRPVGGETHPEAQRPGRVQQRCQLGVQQRLPHHMEVEVPGVAAQLFRDDAKLLRRQEAPLPLRAGAERTGEVAHVGDLHIDTIQHVVALLPAGFLE